jgi:hypothetical protein
MAILGGWSRSVDGAGVRVVRRILGLALAWEVFRFFSNGWIDGLFRSDQFHFTYLGLGWVRPWPGPGMHIHFAVLGLLALGMLIGWRERLCSGLLALGWAQVFLVDQANYLNHLYLVILLLVLLAWVPVRDGRVPRWGFGLLRVQVGLVYVLGGLSKLNSDWLAGEPMTQWMASRGDVPLLGAWLVSPSTGITLSWVGLGFDLLVVPALLWRRTRALAFVVAVVFHGGNALLFHIGIFPWVMLGATTLFFSPDWPRRFLRQRPEVPAAVSIPWGRGTRLAVLTWMLVQLLVPLRHWAYPGDVAWTEEGHRFSWRMKLRSKKGRVFFHVLNKHTGVQAKIDPCVSLSLRHCRKMSTRPDMILQYAHHLRDTRMAAGDRAVAVQVEALARLNQREAQRLVDPTVDLAQVPRNLWPADWIVPLRARD